MGRGGDNATFITLLIVSKFYYNFILDSNILLTKIIKIGTLGNVVVVDKVYTKFENVDVKSEKTPGYLQIRGYKVASKWKIYKKKEK